MKEMLIQEQMTKIPKTLGSPINPCCNRVGSGTECIQHEKYRVRNNDA